MEKILVSLIAGALAVIVASSAASAISASFGKVNAQLVQLAPVKGN